MLIALGYKPKHYKYPKGVPMDLRPLPLTLSIVVTVKTVIEDLYESTKV